MTVSDVEYEWALHIQTYTEQIVTKICVLEQMHAYVLWVSLLACQSN